MRVPFRTAFSRLPQIRKSFPKRYLRGEPRGLEKATTGRGQALVPGPALCCGWRLVLLRLEREKMLRSHGAPQYDGNPIFPCSFIVFPCIDHKNYTNSNRTFEDDE